VRISREQANLKENAGRVVEKHGHIYLKVEHEIPKRDRQHVAMARQAFVRRMRAAVTLAGSPEAVDALWQGMNYCDEARADALAVLASAEQVTSARQAPRPAAVAS
jgi:hypothetical protein